MTTAQVVETPVTNNSLSKDYPHPNDHAKHITKTKQATKEKQCLHILVLVRTSVDLRLRNEWNIWGTLNTEELL